MISYYVYFERPGRPRQYKRDIRGDAWSSYRPECCTYSKESAVRIVRRLNKAVNENRIYRSHPEIKPEYGIERGGRTWTRQTRKE